MTLFIVFFCCWYLILPKSVLSSSGPDTCARDKSRVVANIVKQNILSAYTSQQVPLPSQCPFTLDRDIYAIQEQHKAFEGSGRWTCDFCGKAFVSEFFLDKHFENRHSSQLQTKDSLCLADVCDVFRCDIVSGASVPDYWDVALCLEDDMQDLLAQCQSLIDACVPKGLTPNQTAITKGAIVDNVCSYLNCKLFWNTPFQQEENPHTALYIVLITMTCFGIIIYNFVFYNYFFSEFSETSYDPTPRTKHRIRPYHHTHKPQRDASHFRNRDPGNFKA